VPNSITRGAWLLLAVAIPTCNGVAQDAKTVPNPTVTFRVASRLVVLDVVVTDKAGQLRNDLTRDDFKITENGIPQKINSFEPPSAHVLPPGVPINSTAALERQAPQAPVDILVLDELNTTFQDMAYARYALEKYLKAQPEPLRAPTMLIAVSDDNFQVLRDYTQDRDAILSALDHHLTNYPWHLQAGVSVVQQLAVSLGALEQVAQATSGHPGHKNMVWVGRGFPGIEFASSSFSNEEIEQLTTTVAQASNMLRDARITLYTIDPTALTSSLQVQTDDSSEDGDLSGTGPDPLAGDINFPALALATGGKAFYSRNDVDREIGESVRDGVNYYTLTYTPSSPSTEDKPYRKIHVSIALPGLHAGYRDGYYTGARAQAISNVKRVTYDLDSAEQSTMVYTGLMLTAEPKPGMPNTYSIAVPENQIPWTADGDVQTAKLTLVGIVLDEKSRILRRVTDEMTASRPAEGTDSAGVAARFSIAVPVVAHAVRLRFVLRSDADGRIGTADLKADGTPVSTAPPR